jgi:thioredoxin reductase (NADPH)
LPALVAKDAELSEILMRAFILRRLELIRQGWGNLVVLGSQHSARTLEIREFLSPERASLYIRRSGPRSDLAGTAG